MTDEQKQKLRKLKSDLSIAMQTLHDECNNKDVLRHEAAALKEQLNQFDTDLADSRDENDKLKGDIAQLQVYLDELREEKRLWMNSIDVQSLSSKSQPILTHCIDCCCDRSWKALGITTYSVVLTVDEAEMIVAPNISWADCKKEMDNIKTQLACIEEAKENKNGKE
jgi:hypothetical protein